MSHRHRVGQSAGLTSPWPRADFFNTIGEQRTCLTISGEID
jgi:hypothetical protein